MTNSKRIAGLVGPTLVAVTISEWMNLDIFIDAIGPSFAPHVFLNGTLLFVAGLAIVRSHNLWTRDWPVLLTLVGWFHMLAGLGRMMAPVSAQGAGHHTVLLHGSLAVLFAVGIVLTFQAYRGALAHASRVDPTDHGRRVTTPETR